MSSSEDWYHRSAAFGSVRQRRTSAVGVRRGNARDSRETFLRVFHLGAHLYALRAANKIERIKLPATPKIIPANRSYPFFLLIQSLAILFLNCFLLVKLLPTFHLFPFASFHSSYGSRQARQVDVCAELLQKWSSSKMLLDAFALFAQHILRLKPLAPVL